MYVHSLSAKFQCFQRDNSQDATPGEVNWSIGDYPARDFPLKRLVSRWLALFSLSFLLASAATARRGPQGCLMTVRISRRTRLPLNDGQGVGQNVFIGRFDAGSVTSPSKYSLVLHQVWMAPL